jgi:hypothetical protein
MATSDDPVGTAVEPASVLRLIRDLLPDDAGNDNDGSHSTADVAGNGEKNSNAAKREEAGELLWDLSSDEADAKFMVVGSCSRSGQ